MKKIKTPMNCAFLSTYPPRECGIATFTEDLTSHIEELGLINTHIIAINDTMDIQDSGHFYHEIRQQVATDYVDLAHKLNASNMDLLMIEHEYGIFGGEDGEYILELLKHLTIPVITTLHTILTTPTPGQHRVLHELGKKSDKVVTMASNTKKILVDTYGIDISKIEFIHHGVTKKPFHSRTSLKKKRGFENRQVISTFGLLSPGKGLEYGIEAIRLALDESDKKTYPNNILYLILGATHPMLKEKGIAYRAKLEALVAKLGLEDHVKFVNKYLTKDEIVEYLQLSDIYMTPYLAKDQAVSGTLAYAVGYGKAIVSTPYLYAKEMLKKNGGLLGEFSDAQSLATCINLILSDPVKKKVLERVTGATGKTMFWDQVAGKYTKVILSTVKSKSISAVI